MFLKKYIESYRRYITELKQLDKLLNSKENLQNVSIPAIRIYLTENCNANCSYCFNSKIREERHMDKEKLNSIFHFFKENKTKTLKMMGGEPTVHPDFLEMYSMAQEYFHNVNLFTNALNDNILHISPRNCDGIIYNFLFVTPTFDFNKLLPNFPDFSRVFEIVIDSNTDIVALSKRIDYVHKNCLKLNIMPEKISYQLTYDCMENIFRHKDLLNRKLMKIIKFIIKISPKSISFDHRVPFCFWLPETLSFMKGLNLDYYSGSCWGTDFGLIDAEFNLLHCNQHPIKLMNLFDNGKIIDFKILKNTLVKANLEKRLFNLNKACLNCSYFNENCTGGCLMHKEIIQLDSCNSIVMENT